jgi:CRP-like cAMP-binding protein
MMRYKLHDLLSQEKAYHRSKGQVIQTTDGQKKFHLITKGFIKRYLISNAGTLGVEVIYGPGDVFPLTLVYQAIYEKNISSSPEVFYYEAMCDTEVHSMNIEDLVNHVNEDPLLYKSLFLEAGTRLHSTLQGLENLTLKSSYKRVAHQILYFAERFGAKTDAGVKLQLALTHQDLADVLSVTRETVSNSMGELRKKGLIKTNRYILIPSIKKLKEEAYS